MRDGYVRVFDRKKDMINRGGYKIYSVEVENALMSFPAWSRRRWSASPARCWASACTRSSLRTPGVQPADLKRHCARLLADYKVPETFTLRDQPLPRNANGKLLKRSLRGEVATSST